jgi:glutamate racemase
MTSSSASTSSERPIGLFDSGVGGLSVLRAVRAEMPHEDLLYVGDSQYAPYGDKPAAVVRQRAEAMVAFLMNHRAKAIVVACNTATGIAVDDLRARFPVPIVAVEPAVKPAAALTRSGVVGVLTTAGTAVSPNLTRLVNNYGVDVRFLVQPCPRLADQVERGELNSSSTRSLVEQYVRPLIDQGADTLVLGCTHYPFLTDLIQNVAGGNVQLIDPANAVAREVRRRLNKEGLLANNVHQGSLCFWTTGDAKQMTALVSQLLGESITVTHAVDVDT